VVLGSGSINQAPATPRANDRRGYVVGGLLARTGSSEESYFTFTYSPIRNESSGVGGVFCAVVETTDRVIEGRRLLLLNALPNMRGPAR
jgi:hypothetical protein